MKKFLSTILVFSTLICSVIPVYAGNAENFQSEKVYEFKISPSSKSNESSNIDISSLSEDELKEIILKISQDKNFTDQVVKNYKVTHEDPLWLKIVKFPFKVVWKIFKKAFDYVLGKKVSEFIEEKVFPIVITFLAGSYAYKKIPLVRDFLNWCINDKK